MTRQRRYDAEYDLRTATAHSENSDPETLAFRNPERRCEYRVGKDATVATPHDWLTASIKVVRDRIIERWVESTKEAYEQQESASYLSVAGVPDRPPDARRLLAISACSTPCAGAPLALSPALSIADNMFLGRELRKPGLVGRIFRRLDRSRMQKISRDKLTELGLMTIQNINQSVETLSGGQRQGVAVARAAAFGSRVIIMDEPTAALGVKESRRVLHLIRDVQRRGLPIVLISHNMPHVFEVADRIHIHRLGRRIAVINPRDHSMSDAVAIMTGAMPPPDSAQAA